MKTITKEIKIYKYNELSEKTKQKVKEQYIEDIDSWVFTKNLIQALKAETGLQNLRPYYSLSYCQGGGLCLVGHINFDEINGKLKEIFYKDFIISDYKFLQEIGNYSKIEFNHTGQYYHKNSVDIDIYIDGNLSIQKHKNQRKFASKLIKNARDWYIKKCDEYEKWGYEFFYDVRDEDLEEFYNAMEYEFLENGTFFN